VSSAAKNVFEERLKSSVRWVVSEAKVFFFATWELSSSGRIQMLLLVKGLPASGRTRSGLIEPTRGLESASVVMVCL
jgi:hypothetical protein